MAGRIHVGPNGPGRCNVVPGGPRPCPYDPDSVGKNHYDTVQEAQAAYEAELESAHELTPGFSKRLTPGFSKTPNYPYLPELPKGFEWEVKKTRFGNTNKTKTVIYLKDKTDSEERIVKEYVVTHGDRRVTQDPTESDLQGFARDILETYVAKAAFRGEKPEPFPWQ